MLIKCMQTLPKPKPPLTQPSVNNNEPAESERSALKKRAFASYMASAASSQNPVKPTDHRASSETQPQPAGASTSAGKASTVLPGMYTPGMLRQTSQQKRTKYQLALAAKQTGKSCEDSMISEPMKPQDQQSGAINPVASDTTGAKKVTAAPTKPVQNPFKGLKDKLKQVKVGGQSASPEPPKDNDPKSTQHVKSQPTAGKKMQLISSSQNTQSSKTLTKPSSKYKTPAVVEESDSDTQDSDSELVVPKLSYRKRAVVSSESATEESETESPTRAPRRRSQRIIDSDSEAEDQVTRRQASKGKNRFRRTPGRPFLIS